MLAVENGHIDCVLALISTPSININHADVRTPSPVIVEVAYEGHLPPLHPHSYSRYDVLLPPKPRTYIPPLEENIVIPDIWLIMIEYCPPLCLITLLTL